MGYYSEIGIVFTAECHTHFQAQLAMQSAEVQKEVHSLLEDATIHKKSDNSRECILYHWSYTKWYSHFPCVGFIERFLANLSDEYQEQYLLARVGEEMEDNHEEGCFWENPFELCVGRAVSFS